MNNEEKLNQEVEAQIVHLLMKGPEAVTKFAESANKVKHFEKLNRYIIEALLDYESRNQMLTRASFDAFLDKLHIIPAEKAAALVQFSKCKSSVTGVKPSDLHMLLDKKRSFHIDRTARSLIDEFVRARSKDPVFALKEMTEKAKLALDEVDQYSNISFNDISSDEFYQQWEAEVLQKRDSDIPLIECGIREIDEVMGTGFGEGTLTVICADVGSFKSTLMLNIALNVFDINDKDVLFIGLEMPKNRIYDKIISREARVPFEYFQRPKNVLKDEHIEKVRSVREKMRDKMTGRFVILEFGERTTVGAIKRQIEKHITHHKPALVVVDYIANLDADKPRQGRNDLEIGDMLKELRIMGTKGALTPSGFAVLTGAQLGREALKRMKSQRDKEKLALGSEDIQGSHQYSADATSIFGLMKDPSQPDSTVFIFPIKNRYGKTRYKDGSNRGVLKVTPGESRIESSSSAVWKCEADDSLLKKGNEVTLPFSASFDMELDDLPTQKSTPATPDGLFST